MVKFNNICIRICKHLRWSKPIDLVLSGRFTENVKIRPRNTRPLLILEEMVNDIDITTADDGYAFSVAV